MSEDLSNVLSRFSNILKEKNIDLNNLSSSENTTNPDENKSNQNEFQKSYENDNSENVDNSQNSFNQSSQGDSSNFNIDIETIMKIKDILGKLNSNSYSQRNTLLRALKPYLEDTKKEKLEQYMKIANLLSVLENFEGINFFKFNSQNYDLVLILTLFLLIF